MLIFNREMKLWILMVRFSLIVFICWYVSQAIIAGEKTLGAFIWSLVPALSVGMVFVIVELLLKEGVNFSTIFNFEKLTYKKLITLFVFSLVVGIITIYASPNSPVDVILLLIITGAMVASVILMIKGSGVKAICVFILAWPFMVFERSSGNVGHMWTNNFNILELGLISEDIIWTIFSVVLLISWVLRIVIKKEKIKSESWNTGPLLLLAAGIFSVIFSLNPTVSLQYFISYYFVPVAFFFLFVNEIHSWHDFKKLSLALGIMIAVISFLWLYYAFYRTPVYTSSVSELAYTRGGGGLTLGSRYSGYNGINYEYFVPMIIPVVLALAFTAGKRYKRYIWFSLVMVMISITIYILGRNGFILLVACLLPWFIAGFKVKRHIVIFILICLVVVIFMYDIIGVLFDRFKPLLSLEAIQDEKRIQIWISSIKMFFDYPWSGVGIRMFSNVSADYGLYQSMKSTAGFHYTWVWTNAHGMIFQIISELGLVGIISWFAMFWILLKRLINPIKPPGCWFPEERYWVIAMRSNILVIIILFVLGPFGNFGIESMRVCLFVLWLAMIHIIIKLKYEKVKEGYVHSS